MWGEEGDALCGVRKEMHCVGGGRRCSVWGWEGDALYGGRKEMHCVRGECTVWGDDLGGRGVR